MNTTSNTKISYKDVYTWTDAILFGLRKAMHENNFKEILPIIISKRFEPGAKHSIALLGDRMLPNITENRTQTDNNKRITVTGKDYYYLPVSHVVEKQMSLEFLDKAYCLAPCLRLVMGGEESSGKHLYNFFQFEIEWRTESMEDVFCLAEKILTSTAKQVICQKKYKNDILFLDNGERNTQAIIQGDFPKITFNEALKLLKKNERFTSDLTPEDDHELSMMFDRPFWIYDYPDGVRDSIYHKNDTGSFDTYDLMLPFGYGELTTGGIRPKTSNEIIEQSEKLGKSYNPFYAEWKNKSQIQTAGFGIGLERLLRYMSGSTSITDFVQYHDQGPNEQLIKY